MQKGRHACLPAGKDRVGGLDGLVFGTDALAREEKDSSAAADYANIVAVKSGSENDAAVQELIKALKSDKVKNYIEETYEGAVVPVF